MNALFVEVVDKALTEIANIGITDVAIPSMETSWRRLARVSGISFVTPSFMRWWNLPYRAHWQCSDFKWNKAAVEKVFLVILNL